MNNQKKSLVAEVFIVGCVLCGKKWKAGDDPTCGGMIDGKPMCDERELEQDIGERLKMPNVVGHRLPEGQSELTAGLAPC